MLVTGAQFSFKMRWEGKHKILQVMGILKCTVKINPSEMTSVLEECI